jgi:hypothetical protein
MRTKQRNLEIFQDSDGNVFLIVPESGPQLAGSIGAALAGMAGNVDDGSHAYLISFVTAEGETGFNPKDLGAVSVTVDDQTTDGQVTLSNIPKGSAFVSTRKVYRTLAGADPFMASNYKLVGEILDNVNTTYTDNFADAELGEPIPTENSTANTIFYYDAATGIVTLGAG